jgi:hypothetical protein
MSPDIYHEKWIETMGEWLSENEKNVEGKYYVLRLKNNKRATLSIGIWMIRNTLIKRLLIRLAWFYKYPYSLEALIRRIELLDDKVFYVAPYDVVEVIAYVPWKKVLRKDEVKIEKLDDIFRLLDEISRYFPDEARKDLDILIKNLRSYESYVEY